MRSSPRNAIVSFVALSTIASHTCDSLMLPSPDVTFHSNPGIHLPDSHRGFLCNVGPEECQGVSLPSIDLHCVPTGPIMDGHGPDPRDHRAPEGSDHCRRRE